MNEASTATGTLVRDPICGMDVDPATAANRVDHDGTTYHFRGMHCADAFQKDPQAALAKRSESVPEDRGESIQPTAKGSNKYICPMRPRAESEGPSACPKCGMALELAVPTYTARQVRYTSPMHPRDRAGGASNQIGRDVVAFQTELTFTSLAAFPEQHSGTPLALRKQTTGRYLQGNAERRPT